MTALLQFFISAITIFLTADAVLWFLFQPVSSKSEREKKWAHWRKKKSILFRYGESPIEHIGNAICRWLPQSPTNYRWKLGETVIPFSTPVLAGYQFVLGLLVLITPSFAWFGFQSFTWPLLYAVVGAFLWTLIQVRQAQKRYREKLLQIQIDLGFAIDMAELYHNEEDGKSMSVATAIQKVYEEFKDTSLGEELQIVSADLDGNIALADSLKMMHARLNFDDHVGRFVDLISAQYEGSASKGSLRQLADELNRYRRNLLIDHAEKAKVKLALPTTMVTFACVFVLVAPFVTRMGELVNQFGS